MKRNDDSTNEQKRREFARSRGSKIKQKAPYISSVCGCRGVSRPFMDGLSHDFFIMSAGVAGAVPVKIAGEAGKGKETAKPVALLGFIREEAGAVRRRQSRT